MKVRFLPLQFMKQLTKDYCIYLNFTKVILEHSFNITCSTVFAKITNGIGALLEVLYTSLVRLCVRIPGRSFHPLHIWCTTLFWWSWLHTLGFLTIFRVTQIKDSARSKAWTVYARSNTGIVGSNTTRGMDVCSGHATAWSPAQGALPTVYRLRKWKSGQYPQGL
jgi:hypothetical protein